MFNAEIRQIEKTDENDRAIIKACTLLERVRDDNPENQLLRRKLKLAIVIALFTTVTCSCTDLVVSGEDSYTSSLLASITNGGRRW